MVIASFGRTACVLLLSLLATGAAHAVYRCGNVYQDRPCDDKGPQPHLTPGMRATPEPAGAPSAITPASPFAAACSRAGEEAQKVAWKREGGATRDQQMAEPANASRPAMATIIDSVYRKRGTAPQIRAAIEAECVADKQKEADTAAALKALLQSQQSGTPAPAAAPAAAASAPAAAQKTSAAAPNPSCAAWRSELDTINAEFRRGGNSAAMERLQSRRREVEQSMREGRC